MIPTLLSLATPKVIAMTTSRARISFLPYGVILKLKLLERDLVSNSYITNMINRFETESIAVMYAFRLDISDI